MIKKIIYEIKILRWLIYNKIYISNKSEQEVVDNFHKLYYNSVLFGKTWGDTNWLGTPNQKCPLDLWIYQEIIYDIKPDLIIECGTADGGSALYMATLCDIMKKGKIVTIDIKDSEIKPKHDRIKYLIGSSTSKEIVKQVKSMINKGDKVLVILDSDHRRDHVFDELNIYNKLVSKESYMIVEDTNLNGYPIVPDFVPGPMEALNDFLEKNDDFIIDKSKEKFYLTFNPRGFLKKIS